MLRLISNPEFYSNLFIFSIMIPPGFHLDCRFCCFGGYQNFLGYSQLDPIQVPWDCEPNFLCKKEILSLTFNLCRPALVCQKRLISPPNPRVHSLDVCLSAHYMWNLCLLSDKISCYQISRSLETARHGFKVVRPLKFGRRLGSTAALLLVRFLSNMIILRSKQACSGLREILWWNL